MKKSLVILFAMCILVSIGQNPLAVSLSKEDVRCFKGSAALGISGGVTPYKISWSTGDSNVVSVNNLASGNYSVHVHDDSPKDTIVTFTIEDLGCEVGISNHFTPNDDGFNDTWGIQNVSHYPNFEVFVFNRSGQTVHHQTGTYVPWDGRSFGIKLPDATYYYVFYFDKDSKDKLLKGDVTILR